MPHSDLNKTRHVVCMVSDFFYPNMGGVESHMYQLSQCLLARHHKVIVVTHSYGNRTGVRYLTNGLKVYYLPLMPFYDQNAMGYKVCFTDHSLLGFADWGAININKVLKWTLSDVDHVICVSHTSKENTVLRGLLDPAQVSVIPNAVDCSGFTPNTANRDNSRLNIVVLSRLVYRKGVDLLVDIIPEMCKRYPSVYFIIGGDGAKRLDLEEMREKNQLHDRVEMLGAVKSTAVRDVLTRGHIFLNCSLTEAFCIAIVEAAACGLLVVSTKVGGVPEVLPSNMAILAEPTPDDLIKALEIGLVQVKDVDAHVFHEQVKQMYDWNDVAARTEIVYDRVAKMPKPSLMDRLHRYHSCGVFAGKLFCLIAAWLYLFWLLLQWRLPTRKIERAPDFPFEYYRTVKEKSIVTSANQ